MTDKSHLQLALRYIQAIEAGETGAALLAFLHPDIVQVEFPNRLVPNGASRDLAAIKRGADQGQTAVADQRYEVRSTLACEQRVAMEISWSARLLRPFGESVQGATIRAEFSVFLEFKDGLIISQHNYDCFHPF
jgi:ketosteroid isomerase-like protein